MEHLKMRLCATAVVLVLAAAMLTGASYSWITLSTNPEIRNAITSVTANQNLEIALDDGYATELEVDKASADAGGVQGYDAGNPYTWGNYIDLSKAFKAQSVTLQQTKMTVGGGVKLEGALYDLDGRVESLTELKSLTVSNYDGKGQNGGIKVYAITPGTSTNYAYSVTYWLRSNVTGEVRLSDPAKRANDGRDTTTGVNGEMGQGSYVSIPIAGNGTADVLDRFMRNIRVVFVDESASPSVIFEASIGAGESDGTNRKYKLVTMPGDVGANPIYTSDRTDNKPIALEEYVARKVTMYVYLDGEDITNAQALLYDVTGVEINVQFDNSALVDDDPNGGAMTGDTTTNSAYTNGVAN